MTRFFQFLFRRYPIKTQRALEILPATFALLLILFPVWGSFLVPTWVAFFLIFYNVYWLYKSVSLAINATRAHQRIRAAEKQNWLAKASKLDHFKDVKHILVVLNYKETADKLRKTLDKLTKQTLSPKHLYVVLAMEDREGDEARNRAKVLIHEYKSHFGGIYATYHPDIEGEVKGKSSNEAYAGKWAKKYLVDEKGYDIDYITISSVDADTLFDRQFFAYLTYKFLSDTNRYRKFWQSALVYYNNIWVVPAPIRILSIIGSVWRTGVLMKHVLVTLSVYTLSLKLLDEIGYWDTDVIPEDYRIFFKAFYKLNGHVSVEPIFLQTSLDAAQSPTYWKSLMNKFEQEKRWAWGVSDDPLFIRWWLTVPGIPFYTKTDYLLRIMSDHFLWPVNWFIITIGANIIPLINPVFSRTALGYTLPQLSSFILTACLIGLISILVIDYRQRPPRPASVPAWKPYVLPFEFLLLPIAGFFLSTLPGLIAHIHLMLGKRMEYIVTEKV